MASPVTRSRDYTFSEICNLEDVLRLFKETEGKTSACYLEAKRQLQEIREAHLPFRTYLAWKAGSYELSHSAFLFQFSKDKKSDRAALKKALLTEATPFEENLKLLSKITFLHGSNSSALVMMSLANNPSLQCTGALLGQGIAPMSGELSIGISIAENGVNLGSVSVETLRNVRRVHDYTQGLTLFRPAALFYLTNPWYSCVPPCLITLQYFVNQLQQWKNQDRDEFDSFLSPGKPLTDQFISAIRLRITYLESKTDDYIKELIPPLKELITHLENGEDVCEVSSDSATGGWKDARKRLLNPFASLSAKAEWSRTALQLLQLKQWDEPFFQEHIPPIRARWIEEIDKVKKKSETPLRQLISLIECDFTLDELDFLKNQQAGTLDADTELPAKLQSIFPSCSAIPRPNHPFWSLTSFQKATIQHQMRYYRNGSYRWSDLIIKTIRQKIKGSRQEHLDNIKPIFEAELDLIDKVYRHLISAFQNDAPPAVTIPTDPNTRALITNPIPIIFASTTIRPRPSSHHKNPHEYVLDGPAPLGSHGIDIVFTNTQDSVEKLRKLIPPQHREQIQLLLFNHLECGKTPLIHSPLQIANE
ncbi:MAG: hypothetical protein JSS61_01845 [Verrucomicrobia bacterium]|nr:hypothetical protein [Verrucomicrobiota bacterium]